MITEGLLNLVKFIVNSYIFYINIFINIFIIFFFFFFFFYKVTISQTYKNIEKDPIEARYKFPIHEAAAVCGFEADIDGQRKVKGVVKEAKKAAKEYTEAIEVKNIFIKLIFDIN
jgi:hypothetical protein